MPLHCQLPTAASSQSQTHSATAGEGEAIGPSTRLPTTFCFQVSSHTASLAHFFIVLPFLTSLKMVTISQKPSFLHKGRTLGSTLFLLHYQDSPPKTSGERRGQRMKLLVLLPTQYLFLENIN